MDGVALTVTVIGVVDVLPQYVVASRTYEPASSTLAMGTEYVADVAPVMGCPSLLHWMLGAPAVMVGARVRGASGHTCTVVGCDTITGFMSTRIEPSMPAVCPFIDTTRRRTVPEVTMEAGMFHEYERVVRPPAIESQVTPPSADA